MADDTPDEPIHGTAVEARGGVTPHIVRYVLLASLILVIVAFAIVLYTAS